jgi:hypothetical protein
VKSSCRSCTSQRTKATRAIDIYQGNRTNEAALKDLVSAAVALNRGKPKGK